MLKYTTIQGDTWDIISLKNYNTELYVSNIIEANYKFRDYVFFPAGIVLNIPEVAPQTTINLPPWKL